MILAGFFNNILIAVLCVTLAALVFIIAYRKLLQYMGKGKLPKEKYAVLYSLENNPSKGELEFYFTCEEEKNYRFEILKDDFSFLHLVNEGTMKSGGNILRYDSKLLANGTYYYRLLTDNQKTVKKMHILND